MKLYINAYFKSQNQVLHLFFVSEFIVSMQWNYLKKIRIVENRMIKYPFNYVWSSNYSLRDWIWKKSDKLPFVVLNLIVPSRALSYVYTSQCWRLLDKRFYIQWVFRWGPFFFTISIVNVNSLYPAVDCERLIHCCYLSNIFCFCNFLYLSC